MLHEVVLALTVVFLPQEAQPPAGAGAPPPDTAQPVAAARPLMARPAPRFSEPAPMVELPAPGSLLATSPVAASAPAAPAEPADTPVKRPRAIEYSDWYARRLTIHRIASYTLLPLLAAQYYTGSQLMAKGSDAPLWVIRTHAPLATTAAVVFGANTVTGLWNMWDARHDPNGRTSRMAHSLLMLASDAGFLAAGAMGHPSVTNGSIRSLHRTIALSSMGAALVGYAIMLPPFRK